MINKINVPTAKIELSSKASYLLDKLLERLSLDPSGRSLESLTLYALNYSRDLFSSIGAPLLTNRPWTHLEIPFKEDYQYNCEEVIVDIHSLLEAYPALGNSLIGMANYGEAAFSMEEEKIAKLEAELATLEATINSMGTGHNISPGEIIRFSEEEIQAFADSFNNLDRVNLPQSSQIAIDTVLGYTTLERQEDTNLSEGATIQLLPEKREDKPTGLPGTTLEIESQYLGFMPLLANPEVTLVGSNNARWDPLAMIDGEADTWFEYERAALVNFSGSNRSYTSSGDPSGVSTSYTVTDKRPLIKRILYGPVLQLVRTTQGTSLQPLMQIEDAWFYNPGSPLKNVWEAIAPDKWQVQVTTEDITQPVTMTKVGIPDEGALRLMVATGFDGPQTLNSIDINPFIYEKARNNYNWAQPVLVADDGNEIPLPPRQLSRELSWMINPIGVKGVVLRLFQDKPYDTLIGHPFMVAVVEETSTKKKGPFGIFGKKTRKSVKRTRVSNPSEAYNLVRGGGHGNVITSSTTWTRTLQEVITGFDVFLAGRWPIGVRDFISSRRNYSRSGELASITYEFSKPVTSVRLRVNDNTIYGGAVKDPDSTMYSPTDLRDIPGWGTPASTDTAPADQRMVSIPGRSFTRIDPSPGGISIQYFIKIENNEWREIAPFGSGGIVRGNILIPETINIKRDYPNLEAKRGQVKFRLSRGAEEGDEGYSPIIFSYQLDGISIKEL